MWLDFDLPHEHASRIRVECRLGTPLGAVAAAAGLPPGPWWCGPEQLTSDAVAGVAPVRHAALITPRAGATGPLWRGAQLVSVAGPDAGRVIPLSRVTAIGALPHGGWQDASVDTHHATAVLDGVSRVVLTDGGSTNGIRWWDEAYPHRWSPRRRRLVLAHGDCAALGGTVVQFRSGGSFAMPAFGGLTWLNPMARVNDLSGDAEGRTARNWPHHWWDADLLITGPHRIGVTRAVILARGRQLPAPSPLAESWQHVLPPAAAHDRPVRWSGKHGRRGGTNATTVHTTVHTTERGTSLVSGRASLSIPLCAVAADSAESIARALASAVPPLPPVLTRGDLAARAGVGVGLGASDVPGPDGVCMLPGDRSWVVLVAGAAGTGKTTTIASLLAGVSEADSADGWASVLVSPEPPLSTAFVASTAWLASADAHARLEAVLRMRARRVLLAIDDAHLLDVDTLRLIFSVVRQRDRRVSVVLAAERASGTFPADLIARADALVCLRTHTRGESLDFIGVEDAAMLPAGDPGLAFVRSNGMRRLIRIATPPTTPSAASRIIGDRSGLRDASI